MRNAAKKMTNPIDPCTENYFLSFIEISQQNGSLCGSHSGSLWLSLAQKALARLATSQLHSSSLSHSGTDMWILAFKISSLPVPSRPATRSFCHYPTRSRPEVKNHYPSGPVEQTTREDRATQLSCATLQMLSSPNIWRFCELRCIAIHFVHRMNCDAQEFCKRIMKDYLAWIAMQNILVR